MILFLILVGLLLFVLVVRLLYWDSKDNPFSAQDEKKNVFPTALLVLTAVALVLWKMLYR